MRNQTMALLANLFTAKRGVSNNPTIECDRNILPDDRPLKLMDLVLTAPNFGTSGRLELEKYEQCKTPFDSHELCVVFFSV